MQGNGVGQATDCTGLVSPMCIRQPRESVLRWYDPFVDAELREMTWGIIVFDSVNIDGS
jgi:hypothetical protein